MLQQMRLQVWLKLDGFLVFLGFHSVVEMDAHAPVMHDGPTLRAREIGNVEGQTLWPWACGADAIKLIQIAHEAIRLLITGSLIEAATGAKAGFGRLANLVRVRGLDVSHCIALQIGMCASLRKAAAEAKPAAAKFREETRRFYLPGS